MHLNTRYKFTVEDESRLENVANASAPLWKWALGGLVLVLAAVLAGALVVVLSPARYLLPGYLKESERAASEEQHMRLDSLQDAYDKNAAFLENLHNVFYPSSAAAPRDTAAPSTVALTPDSLLPTSAEERKFLAMMGEREKFNISVIAPLAAESMMFFPVNDMAVVAEDSRADFKARILLARGAPVAAVADGKVIAVSQSLREGGGTAVIVQHSKGFLSRLSRLGTVLVEPGDDVAGGQVIAVPAPGSARKDEVVLLEMWHNGTPLVPYDYIGRPEADSRRYPVIDEEVGRGRL